MNNKQDIQSDTISQEPDTKSVTTSILNTHCTVCGKPFQKARASKLYCSNRCKQYGHNHRSEIRQVLKVREEGINRRPLTFFIDDYVRYDNMQKMLRRYRELKKKSSYWQSKEQEIHYRQRLQLPIPDYLFDSYASRKLSEEEDFELDNAETELDEKIIYLNPRELSIEQWSFVKALHPSLDELSFFRVASCLSREFFDQLNLSEAQSKRSEYVVIKNKFINHCNLIATGVIKFEIREQAPSPPIS